MTVLAALAVAVACGAAAVVAWSRFVTRAPQDAVGAQAVEQRRVGQAASPGRAAWLRQAGVELAPFELWSIAIGGAGVTFAAVAVVTRTPLVAVPPALGVGALPLAYLGHRRNVRLRAWQGAWPDALREILAAIVAGRSLRQGLEGLGTTGPELLREVFGDFASLARVFGTEAALEQVRARMADPTSDRVIEVLLVAHQRGGGIVREVLEDLVVATTRDVKVLEEIDTDGLEMRINARAVLALPWLVLVALTLRPGPFRDFYRTRPGLLVVLAAAGLAAFGAWWLGRLGRGAEEPRVFAGPADSGVAER